MADITLSTIETLVRYILGDYSHTMVPGDIFIYENSSVFTLTESNPIAITEVLKNDVELSSGEYSYNSTTGKITISASLVSGDTIEVQYTYYPNYSSTEIQNYIYSALVYLSVNNYYDFQIQSSIIYPEPTVVEKNLIALVTATLIEPDNKSFRLPDLSITVPNDLPLQDKITKLISVAKRNTHGVFDTVQNDFE